MESKNTPLIPKFSGETSLVVPEMLARCSTKEARLCLDYETALKLMLLPLGITKQHGREILTLSSSGPCTQELISAARFAAGKEVAIVYTRCADIKHAIFVAYQGDVENLSKQALKLKSISPANSPALPSDFRKVKGDENRFLTALIDYAIARRASDIHLIPRRDGSLVKLRVAGKLYSHEAPLGDKKIHQTLINRIKVLSNLDTSQHQKPLDGSFEVPLPDSISSIRVSIIPTIHGEKAVLRLLSFQEIPALDEIGFEKNILAELKSALNRHSGLIFFCGPTGSGKSTSLYSALQTLTGNGKNVVTLEDPVECIVDGASQTSLNQKTGLDYCTGLKAVMRQDPDAILLGEIRDQQSANQAIQAALTGHLILSTIHGGDPHEALKRLKNFGISDEELDIVSLIITQRLFKKLCQKCKVIDLFASNALGATIVKPAGCAECDHSGFDGVVLASGALITQKEDILLDKSMRELLEKGFICMQQYTEFK
jgi:type II secretory ATPase GspE/PulE/Tfp pilus assembly ATPase PilB-like protein